MVNTRPMQHKSQKNINSLFYTNCDSGEEKAKFQMQIATIKCLNFQTQQASLMFSRSAWKIKENEKVEQV
jgi:hypothetical protein